jgi:hypothetical protein
MAQTGIISEKSALLNSKISIIACSVEFITIALTILDSYSLSIHPLFAAHAYFANSTGK